MKRLIIHTDGGSRGNPGPAAIGVDIKTETGATVIGFGRTIGVNTNNFAEYQAVIAALNWIKESETNVTAIETEAKTTNNASSIRVIDGIDFYLDSLLVVNQLKGIYRIKEPQLKSLVLQVKALEQKIGKPVTYSHVRRELNKEADRLVNEALDRNGQ